MGNWELGKTENVDVMFIIYNLYYITQWLLKFSVESCQEKNVWQCACELQLVSKNWRKWSTDPNCSVPTFVDVKIYNQLQE